MQFFFVLHYLFSKAKTIIVQTPWASISLQAYHRTMSMKLTDGEIY